MLLISPKESAGLTGVVDKAIDAKIPVIVLDRNVDTKRITQFIGGDNATIGRAAVSDMLRNAPTAVGRTAERNASSIPRSSM